MENYGLTTYQRKYALDKLHRNIEYMNDNGITMDGRFVPYAEFVQNSYNNSDRYIAEIQHRAWNMFDYARENDLENLMFTLTLPTEWHPLKRKYPKSKTDKTMIFNQKFGGRKYITKINGYKIMNCIVTQNIPFIDPILDYSPMDKFSPRNASKQLSKMLKRFFDDRAYKSIDKDLRCYFRVTEPHKDGTPHIHMSLFIPKDKKVRIVKALTRLYPAPLGEIEINIKKPVHYLMKYVLKTFDDLRKEKEITNLTLWYLYHGISRFYTSRTFINLNIYRKLHGLYELKELSEKYRNEEVRVYFYKDTNNLCLIENEYGTLYVPKPINLEDKEDYTYLEAEFEPIYKEKEEKPIPIDFDGEECFYFKGEVFTPVKKPYQMNDMELYTYYQNIDIETVEYKHYLYTRNLLIERGYDVGEKVSLDFELEGAF
jgi:hypothetical protein